MVVMYEIVKAMQHIHIYIYTHILYMPVKVNEWMSLNNRYFTTWKIAYPWWGSNPLSLNYILSSINSHHRSPNQCISNIFLNIRGFKPGNYLRKWQKYELEISDVSHFEFYELWGEGAIYSLAYGRNGFSTQNSYRNNKWNTFPQKCLQVFIFGYI